MGAAVQVCSKFGRWWVVYFSELFRVWNPEQYEWFDPILEIDCPLFVDPFAIFADRDAAWRDAHDEIIAYFHDAFEMLAKSGLRKGHQYYNRTLSLMEFPEPKEFRLGYAGKGSDGAGSGPGLARRIVESMTYAIKNGLQDIRHFEVLGILVEGINKDRISDITCNLLKPRFITYTQEVCRSFDIPMSECRIRHSAYNELRSRWDDKEHEVPVDPVSGRPVLLVPKRFLAELPKMNDFDFADTSLRDDLNLDISKNVKKSEIVRLARRTPELLREWTSRQEQTEFVPYDVDADPKLIVQWQRVAKAIVQDAPSPSSDEISGEENLMKFVYGIIDKFRRWAEDKGGWRVFWDGNSNAIPEPNMQLLFLGILDGYCERAGIRLDREVETGRGPVDFAITGDRRIRVLVEMKKLTHGEFWHGLRVQTPIYMRGQEVNRAIFLAIRDSSTRPMRDRWDKLEEEASAVRAETGLTIEVERIDILPRRSASKA
jgi:hypothetical protein